MLSFTRIINFNNKAHFTLDEFVKIVSLGTCLDWWNYWSILHRRTETSVIVNREHYKYIINDFFFPQLGGDCHFEKDGAMSNTRRQNIKFFWFKFSGRLISRNDIILTS